MAADKMHCGSHGKGCLPALRGDHGQFPLLDDMQDLITDLRAW